jgi:hypothetical protein
MLKILFSSLLLANAGLLAYHAGYFDAMLSSDREPARMANQLNAGKIRLIPGPGPVSTSGSAAPSAPMSADNPQALSCTEVGNFRAEEASRFEARLGTLALADKVSRRTVRESASQMVFIPPQGDKEGADKRVAELRQLGIDDFYVIQDSSSMRWGISLGVFKSEEGARAHLAELSRRGVRSARIGPYGTGPAMVVFQLRGIDAGTQEKIRGIAADFPRQEVRACGIG